MRLFVRRALVTHAVASALTVHTAIASAQGMSDAAARDASSSEGGAPIVEHASCRPEALGCASAPIEFRRREGLPVELDWDTSWVPAGSPVQVRFRAAFVGHTEVRLGGALDASWPRSIELEAQPGEPMSGLLASDYGVQLLARVRLHLEVSGRTFDWEGNIPYVPRVDFRATARANIDPWAWRRTTVRGMTLRQRLADVPLTDAIIAIPGISGGLSFEASAALETGYQSTRISFAPATDAITESVSRITLPFAGGALVEYHPRLEGLLDQTITITVTPSLYVELLGRRWTIPVVDVPVPIRTPPRPWLFDAQRVAFELPDIAPLPSVVDFGEVLVGETRTQSVSVDNRGGATLVLLRSTDVDTAPFRWVEPRIEIPARGFRAVEMAFAPEREGAIELRVPLVTSDPDRPTVFITARGRGVARASLPDASLPDASADVVSTRDAADASSPGAAMTGGCGCATPARAPSERPLPLVLSLSLTALVARRRGRRSSSV